MRANRLEAFSDGVIAIIITIMVLALNPPHDQTLAGLSKVLPTLFSYALSFLIVAIYWVNHHHLIHLVQKVDAGILWANINLLFWMSLIPWVTAYLGESHASQLSVGLYAAIATMSSISFYLLRRSIACHHRGDARLNALHCRLGPKNLIAIGIYIAAVLMAWVNVPISLFLIALPAMMYFVPDKNIEKLLEEN